jgi:hypothetical protein
VIADEANTILVRAASALKAATLISCDPAFGLFDTKVLW